MRRLLFPHYYIRAWISLWRNPPGMVFNLPLPSKEELRKMRDEGEREE